MKTLAALTFAALLAVTAAHAQTGTSSAGASAPHGDAKSQRGAGSPPPPSVPRTPHDAEHAPTRKSSAPAGLGQQAGGRGASAAGSGTSGR